MMKNIININLSILVLMVFTISAFGEKSNERIIFETGKWQTIVDGQANEGAFFYRFNFEENGNVEIIKQMGGLDNIVENKHWSQEGNFIKIESYSDDIITEFDGTKLELTTGDSIKYKSGLYSGIVKPYKHKIALIHWVLILIVLIGINELFRKSKYATIAFYILIPIFLTPIVWMQQDVTYWFKWVKIYSVIFAVIWFTLIRYTSLGKYNWVKLIAALFLGVNIFEAVSQDFAMGYLPNIFNGIAGLLNIITLFYGWKQIGPDKSKIKDMVWPKMTIMWIVAYDIWNITYVYLNFPGSTSAQAMVILACTIPALFIKKGTWLQARGFTLAAWFMYYFTFPRFTEQMELLVPRSYTIMIIVSAISLIINIAYLVVFIKNIRQDKKLMLAA